MFREHPSWITLGFRICCGILPLAACTVLILMLLSVTWREFGWTWVSIGVGVSVTVGLATGIVVAYLLGRYIEPKMVEYLHRRTRLAGLQDHISDIREVGEQRSEPPECDLDQVFKQAIAEQTVYLGQDQTGQPVSIPRSTWKTSHVQIMGPPGMGKGIQAGVTLTQSLQFGDVVFVFDPKDDEWAPSVYQAACASASVPFEFVDLRQPQPQINPILNALPEEVEEMFYAGFELGRRGNVADFYRLDDRKAARLAASFVTDSAITLAEIGSQAKNVGDKELMTGGKAFFAALDEISELKCVQTKEGINLGERLARGGCLYIVGSMRNEPIITLQKILLVRLIQLLERNRNRQRHCSIFLDEFRYLISLPALNALGSIRDKGCNILLAHQSLGDFANCGSDLSEAAVRATVLDTTPIKWLYRPADYETASWISNQTGEILVATQVQQAARNLELSESLSPSRSVGESKRNLIDVNTVQTMPKGYAVCIGAGIPQLAFTKPMQVKKITPSVVNAALTVAPGIDLLTRLDESIDNSEAAVTSPSIDWDGDPKEMLLRYLFAETWTHVSIVNKLFEQSTDTQIRELLNELSRAKLIRKVEVSFLEDSASEIWGITRHGIARVQENLNIAESRTAFNKRAVNPTSFSHQLDIQRIRIVAERGGWQNWGRYSGSDGLLQKGQIYPDAVAVRPNGSKIAIEVERTIKTKDRYPRIMAAHLHGRKVGRWDQIYYMCPNAQVKMRLERIFSKISEIHYFGSTINITEAHRQPFQFFVYDENWV